MRHVVKLAFVAIVGLVIAGMPAGFAANSETDQQVEIEKCEITPEQVTMLHTASGGELYAEFCSACHGTDGVGNPDAGKALATVIPDLTQMQARSESGEFPEERVVYVLRHPAPKDEVTGHQVESMPDWYAIVTGTGCEPVVEAAVVQRLVEHLRTLQK